MGRKRKRSKTKSSNKVFPSAYDPFASTEDKNNSESAATEASAIVYDPPNKKKYRDRFWIEKCGEKVSNKEYNRKSFFREKALLVEITKVNLRDDILMGVSSMQKKMDKGGKSEVEKYNGEERENDSEERDDEVENADNDEEEELDDENGHENEMQAVNQSKQKKDQLQVAVEEEEKEETELYQEEKDEEQHEKNNEEEEEVDEDMMPNKRLKLNTEINQIEQSAPQVNEITQLSPTEDKDEVETKADEVKTKVYKPLKATESELDCNIPAEMMNEKVEEIKAPVKEVETKEVSENIKEAEESNKKSELRIIRSPSADRPAKHKYKTANYQHLPNGDCGDGIPNPHPNSIVENKYWAQRRRIFMKFDEGIQLDSQGWYSTTPEVIAKHIAGRSACRVVLDAFCGCGGNAIAYALHERVSRVIAVDLDFEKLKMAAHNAKLYGVPPEKLLFIHGDAIDVLLRYKNGESVENDEEKKQMCESALIDGYSVGSYELLPSRIDLVFLSPPWGGPEYQQNSGRKGYHFSNLVIHRNSNPLGTETGTVSSVKKALRGGDLLKYSMMAVEKKKVVVFLPRNTNGSTFGKSVLYAMGDAVIDFVEMEQNVLNGKLKTITAYIKCT